MDFPGSSFQANPGAAGTPGGSQSPAVTTSMRTAVLVVHGMGSQRALQTVRGIVDAVWMQDGKATAGLPGSPRQVWTHPEYSGVDIDLSVMTTSGLPVTKPPAEVRSVDFHELYWAHLMSETRAVAVLLWLFELVRKGPYLKPGMKALWWGASIFLCMLLASGVLLGLHAVLLFLNHPPLIDNKFQFGIVNGSVLTLVNRSYHEPEALILAPFFVLFMVATYVAIASLIKRAFYIAVPAVIVTGITSWIYFWTHHEPIRHLTVIFLPIVLSVCLATLIMGRWGAKVMLITYVLAGLFFGIYLHSRYMIDWDGCLFSLPKFISPNECFPYFVSLKPFANVWNESWLFWSLNERYSSVIAVSVILIYGALYALFLQPYLGDAARYFRNSPGNVAVRREIRKQAVDTLDALHASGKYDRIVVVAHSLGTVVAYDMLRAYFSRTCNHLPNPATLSGHIAQVDNYKAVPNPSPAQKSALRSAAREIIRDIAASPQVKPNAASNQPAARKWLVTDFVTLGSPLTHAHYLMCNGDTYEALQDDFDRRVREREFPTCPPERRSPDGLLLFTNPKTKEQHFHHGGLFGLTRWTNLYFPMRELFWGDAIGGPLAPIFGPDVEDVEVSTFTPSKPAFFTHTEYWSGKWPAGYQASQIQALQAAINLEDK
jgi:hypothetical protein